MSEFIDLSVDGMVRYVPIIPHDVEVVDEDMIDLTGDDGSQDKEVVDLTGDDGSQDREVVDLTGDYGAQEKEVVDLTGDDGAQDKEVVDLTGDYGAQEKEVLDHSDVATDGTQDKKLASRDFGDDGSRDKKLTARDDPDNLEDKKIAYQEREMMRLIGESIAAAELDDKMAMRNEESPPIYDDYDSEDDIVEDMVTEDQAYQDYLLSLMVDA